MTITKPMGLKEWREAIKASGQYLIDHADDILQEGERVRTIDVRLKGIEYGTIPILEITKGYNVLEMVDYTVPRGKND